ncbi:hypothetical protein KSC_043130 [Ktedonobacter sp. SOSP1-52]|nr:hypothetical protein KSC_043130 [Ktedonobacter sp. SOSP1-52]
MAVSMRLSFKSQAAMSFFSHEVRAQMRFVCIVFCLKMPLSLDAQVVCRSVLAICSADDDRHAHPGSPPM